MSTLDLSQPLWAIAASIADLMETVGVSREAYTGSLDTRNNGFWPKSQKLVTEAFLTSPGGQQERLTYEASIGENLTDQAWLTLVANQWALYGCGMLENETLRMTYEVWAFTPSDFRSTFVVARINDEIVLHPVTVT